MSAHARVTRLSFPGRVVVRKEPLGPDAQRRLAHEVAMLERLRGVVGVAQLLRAPRHPGSIMLADAGDTSLAGQATPLAAGELIGLAVELARAVAGMHRRGVMHRDISPANVVLSSDGAVCLVDFALATSFAELRPEFSHHARIVGTLEYLAPEQTGRTGRAVDQRADLYALGATLYELATGEPPFGTGDPLRLTHEHLAREPRPPNEVNSAIPMPLSEIILHLLEKEPDNRYQTADGLLHDLERLRDGDARPTEFQLGERDVPLRLLPSRLVGREDEVAALEGTFEEARAGRCRGVLIGGAPGVGKTALVDQLRPVVTGGDGWFVTGKFDQYRRDLEFDGVYQAFRALGRLLLAEPEEALAEVRVRILEAVGANAGLLTATVPELAALLEVASDPGDPLTAQVRVQRVAAEVLRAVASRIRPLVVFLDDLQWAGRTPLGFVDLVLGEEPIEGLLLVVAYRDGDVDAAHPMVPLMARWRDQADVLHLRLGNLPESGTAAMIADMLHIDQAAAAGLVGAVGPQTSGNPHETAELLGALHRDGVLTVTAGGWRWDEAAVRAHLGRSTVPALSAARIDALPARSRAVVEAMACLGGRAELSVVQTAIGESADVVGEALAPALDDGLLVLEPSPPPAVRFRHDRIREAILHGLDRSRRRTLHVAMARRLAGVPELFAAAAEQYLPAVDTVDDPLERRHVVDLLRRAADQAALIGDHALVDALLTAALRLADPDDTATLIELHIGRHAARYGLGRLEEADEEYRTIEGLSATAMQRADATAVQVRSLTHRNRFAEAVGLGVESLHELGIAVPAADRVEAELGHHADRLFRWLDDTEVADDVARPDIAHPALLAASALIDATLPAAYFAGNFPMYAWLSLEALRIWIEHGPARRLLGAACHAIPPTLVLHRDYSVMYRARRRIVALGEARGYEPDTSRARQMFAAASCWGEPVENTVREAQRARAGLIAGGDLATAGYTYYLSVAGLLDCAPTLDACATAAEEALAFTRRTGSEQTGQLMDSYRWLTAVLRGDTSAAAGEEAAPDRYLGNPLALFTAHLTHAIAAAVLDDQPGLAHHAAAAMPLVGSALGLYPSASAHLLHALALAERARGRDDERGPLLSELDDVVQWLADRATDAPDNFLHLLRLVEAERAWAVGEFRAAALAFDAARRKAADRRRPWHRALITERAAHFHLAHGLDQTGHDLLGQARRQFAAWGASAKVAQLDWAYPALQSHIEPREGQSADQPADLVPRQPTVTTSTLDLLGIVSASRALSSETSLERLHGRVVEVLGAMTGATAVLLLLWDDDRQDWLQPSTGTGTESISGTGRETVVPMSVVRYVQRTGEPLVVADATRDDRFCRDRYFVDLRCCSLLATPILSRGAPRALLLIENRLIRGAFTTERLDAVKLIAGQLAVSLDNAQLYAEYRRIAEEQAALRRVATLVAQAASPDAVFAAVAAEVGRVLAVDHVHAIRFDPDGAVTVVGIWSSSGTAVPVGTRVGLGGRNVATLVAETGRAARIDRYGADTSGSLADLGRRLGARSLAGAPITVQGHLWGVMTVSSVREESLPAHTEGRLAAFTELVATALANAESQAQLTASRARIVAAADQARHRIERDLHDGAQQRLVSLALQARAAQAAVPSEAGELAAQLDNLAAGLTEALDELRELSRGIHPAILAEGGLFAALKGLARRSAVPVEPDVRVDRRLPEQIEIAVYYLVAEALANAAKHAYASVVHVEVDTAHGDADDVLRVRVRDDGRGGADLADGSGLVGLKDRVEALGGRLDVQSAPGVGTTVYAELPLGPRGLRSTG
ncbi:AAA family ATPase [Pseudonocardia sp. DSM 110487]|uniref:AAA family ATPase n=1 Tax=Pseudonocardia sp. DSM 110487 TaxID=2865833 RepID=UPI001C69B9FC|nr:AAA family ATPase [Pseudonocardia sp. DSM 110487]QYN38753.1 AAA family ATPase [Pseudonocardia sp. DSM 110487]